MVADDIEAPCPVSLPAVVTSPGGAAADCSVSTDPATISKYQCACCELGRPLCSLFKRSHICKYHPCHLEEPKKPYCITATTKSTTSIDFLPQKPTHTHPFLVTGFGDLGKKNVEFGEKWVKSCGEFIKVAKCPQCDTIKSVIKVSCNQQFCPECWSKWASKQKERALSRITGYHDLFYSTCPKGTRLGSLKHFIFSPHPAYVESMIAKYQKETHTTWYGFTLAIVKMRLKLIKLMRHHGLMGGCIIFHPYRIKDDIKDQLSALKSDKKYWVLIRENALNLDTVYDYLEFGPHFHVLAHGFMTKSDLFYYDTGMYHKGGGIWDFDKNIAWIYKNKGNLRTNNEIAACLFYALSHAGIMDDKHTLTWFGSLSYDKMVIDKEWIEKRPILCDKCDTPLVVLWLDDLDNPNPSGYYKNVIHRKYAFRIRVYQMHIAQKIRAKQSACAKALVESVIIKTNSAHAKLDRVFSDTAVRYNGATSWG